MAEALGTTQPAIKQAMKRLRAIGFVEDFGEVRERATARFRAVEK
jgi:predicted ArsR family transcriptional regulator